MALACLKVVEVVCRSDLHGTGAKLEVDEHGVTHDWNVSSRERQSDCPADEVAIAWIVRVYSHRSVAEHGFWTRCRDDQCGVWVVCKRISDVIQLSSNIFMLHFDVGQGGQTARTPIDQTLA